METQSEENSWYFYIQVVAIEKNSVKQLSMEHIWLIFDYSQRDDIGRDLKRHVGLSGIERARIISL